MCIAPAEAICVRTPRAHTRRASPIPWGGPIDQIAPCLVIIPSRHVWSTMLRGSEVQQRVGAAPSSHRARASRRLFLLLRGHEHLVQQVVMEVITTVARVDEGAVHAVGVDKGALLRSVAHVNVSASGAPHASAAGARCGCGRQRLGIGRARRAHEMQCSAR